MTSRNELLGHIDAAELAVSTDLDQLISDAAEALLAIMARTTIQGGN